MISKFLIFSPLTLPFDGTWPDLAALHALPSCLPQEGQGEVFVTCHGTIWAMKKEPWLRVRVYK